MKRPKIKSYETNQVFGQPKPTEKLSDYIREGRKRHEANPGSHKLKKRIRSAGAVAGATAAILRSYNRKREELAIPVGFDGSKGETLEQRKKRWAPPPARRRKERGLLGKERYI